MKIELKSIGIIHTPYFESADIPIQDNRIYFSEADMFDGTPLLDIKPYIKYFDYRDDVIRVCPKTYPALSLRGAFCATKQSPLVYEEIASAKNASQ